MKKYLFVALVAMLGLSTNVSAQITEAEPTAHTIRTGNRAEKGNWGIYMGVNSNMFKNWQSKDIRMNSLPLLNAKYMLTDRWEVRAGIEMYKTRSRKKGALIKTYEEDGTPDETLDQKHSEVHSEVGIAPGFAYHFAKTNILDVYAGVELPFGWARNSVTDSDEHKDEDGSLYTVTKKTSDHSYFKIGTGAFIGLQCFIGRLPLALGVEYGLSSSFRCGDKYVESHKGKDVNYTYHYDYNADGSVNKAAVYKSLSKRTTELGSQFRVTLSYYFK